MSNKVGDPRGGKGPEEIGAGALGAVGAPEGQPAGADAPAEEGAPGAKRTARPMSANIGGLSLLSRLEAKLAAAGAGAAAATGAKRSEFDPAVIKAAIDKVFSGHTVEATGTSGLEWTISRDGEPAYKLSIEGDRTMRLARADGRPGEVSCEVRPDADFVRVMSELKVQLDSEKPHGWDPLPPGGGPRPKPVLAGPVVRGPKGPPPRPHVGAVDAQKLEALIRAGDATKLGLELYDTIDHLVTVDRRHGIQLNPNATEGDLNRFKMMLQVLEEHGKLDDLRRALHGPSAGPRLVFGTVEDVMDKLVREHGTKGQKKAWDSAAGALPGRPVGTPVPVPLPGRPGAGGPPPRPHVGAVDAQKLEALIRAGDATKLGLELYDTIDHLVTVDRRHGIQLNPNATEGDINRFKMMLQVLEEHGKLDDLRRALHGPSAGPRLVFGTVEDVMDKLVREHGTKGQKKAWGSAAGALPGRPVGTPVPVPGRPVIGRPPPRPHSGTADARALEALLPSNDATKIGGALYEKIANLVTLDPVKGMELNRNATEGEINRFRMMLQTLEADGKLDDMHRALRGPSAGPRLVHGTVESVMTYLIYSYGTPTQEKTWAQA